MWDLSESEFAMDYRHAQAQLHPLVLELLAAHNPVVIATALIETGYRLSGAVVRCAPEMTSDPQTVLEQFGRMGAHAFQGAFAACSRQFYHAQLTE